MQKLRSTLVTAFVLALVSLTLTTAFVARPADAQALGTWTSTTNYPTIVVNQSCDVSGGDIYCVGGATSSTFASAVYYAPISSTGVGSWSSTTSYPISVESQSCVVSGGDIYCVGGSTLQGVTSAVYYAPISSTGVGAWTSTTSYPIIINDQSCDVSGVDIYCVGGDASTSFTSAVYYASTVLPVTVTSTATTTLTTTSVSTSTTTATSTQTVTSTATVTSTTTATLAVLVPTTTTVKCDLSTVQVQHDTQCTSTTTSADNGQPAGTVAFSSTDTGGVFGTVRCHSDNGQGRDIAVANYNGGNNNALVCTVTYTPSATGSQTITASYSGDAYHAPSAGTFHLSVVQGGHDGRAAQSTLSPVWLALSSQPSYALALGTFALMGASLLTTGLRRSRARKLQLGI